LTSEAQYKFWKDLISNELRRVHHERVDKKEPA